MQQVTNTYAHTFTHTHARTHTVEMLLQLHRNTKHTASSCPCPQTKKEKVIVELQTNYELCKWKCLVQLLLPPFFSCFSSSSSYASSSRIAGLRCCPALAVVDNLKFESNGTELPGGRRSGVLASMLTDFCIISGPA